MNGYRFEVFKDTAGEYRWHFQAPNGEIVAQSEGYATKAGARKGAQVLIDKAGEAALVEV